MPCDRVHPGLWMPRRADGHRSSGGLRWRVSRNFIFRTSLDRAAYYARLSPGSTDFGGAVSYKYDEPGIRILPGASRRPGAGCRDGSNFGTHGPVHLEFVETAAIDQRIPEKARSRSES